jgi:alpha-ketoglutaric semialdehyde dehydrogenase
MPTHPVLIAGQWRAATATGTFRAENPATGEALPHEYPVSAWEDVDTALRAASEAMPALRGAPPEDLARFLTRYAERIESRADEIVGLANLETALPRSPRLAESELPRGSRPASPASARGTVSSAVDRPIPAEASRSRPPSCRRRS